MKHHLLHHRSGFTLVEVVLALGVAAFCLLSVFGLLPIGVNTNHDAVQETGAANIARAIVSDLRAAPPSTTTTGTAVLTNLFQIPIPSPASLTGTNIQTNVLFFREDGSVAQSGTNILINQRADPTQDPHYRVTLYFSIDRSNFNPPITSGTSTRVATNARVLITWPGLADITGTGSPVYYTGAFESVTALDRN